MGGPRGQKALLSLRFKANLAKFEKIKMQKSEILQFVEVNFGLILEPQCQNFNGVLPKNNKKEADDILRKEKTKVWRNRQNIHDTTGF